MKILTSWMLFLRIVDINDDDDDNYGYDDIAKYYSRIILHEYTIIIDRSIINYIHQSLMKKYSAEQIKNDA